MHLVLVFLGWLVGFQAVSVYAGPSRITFIISAAFPEATRQGLHPIPCPRFVCTDMHGPLFIVAHTPPYLIMHGPTVLAFTKIQTSPPLFRPCVGCSLFMVEHRE